MRVNRWGNKVQSLDDRLLTLDKVCVKTFTLEFRRRLMYMYWHKIAQVLNGQMCVIIFVQFWADTNVCFVTIGSS